MADEIVIKGKHDYDDEVFTVERLEGLLQDAEIFNDGRLAGYHGPHVETYECRIPLDEDRNLFVRAVCTHRRHYFQNRGFFELDSAIWNAISNYPYFSYVNIEYPPQIGEIVPEGTSFNYDKSQKKNSKKLYKVMKRLYERHEQVEK